MLCSVDRVRNYAAQVQAKPVAYSALILDYGTLDLPPGPNLIDVENAYTVLQQFARRRTALLNLLNNIDYVRENQDQFVSPDLPALNSAADDIANSLPKFRPN
jgi:hypothetical protein